MANIGYLNIPINLLIYTATNSKYGQCQLYCYLKANSNGIINIDNKIQIDFCKIADINPKTFKSYIKFLIKNKFIYKIDNNNKYCIQSFKKLSFIIPYVTKKGAIYEPLDFLHFKSFVDASVILYYGLRKKHIEKHKILKSKNGNRISSVKVDNRSLFSGRTSSKSFFMPHTYLAKCLNIKVGKARLMRKSARYYLIAKPRFKFLSLNSLFAHSYRKYDDDAHKLRFIKNLFYTQESHYLYCNLVLRKIYYVEKKCIDFNR